MSWTIFTRGKHVDTWDSMKSEIKFEKTFENSQKWYKSKNTTGLIISKNFKLVRVHLADLEACKDWYSVLRLASRKRGACAATREGNPKPQTAQRGL